MFDERVFPYSPQGGFRYFKGHFRTRWCLRCVFCSVMHHCVVRRSGSVPTEITEPALEARSSRHVFIETLQSKDFLASLLICGNFQITAFRVHSSWEPKIILKTVPHPKQSGHIIVLGVGSLSYKYLIPISVPFPDGSRLTSAIPPLITGMDGGRWPRSTSMTTGTWYSPSTPYTASY